MASLFKDAGYDYKTMKIGEEMVPLKSIKVASMENGKKVFRRVLHLINKGTTKNCYHIVTSRGNFVAGENHQIYDYDDSKYRSVKEAYDLEQFYSLNADNQREKVSIEKLEEETTILDIEVEGTNSYLAGGILNHNSNFGAGAKALAEMLRKINILCANYNTTWFHISQERTNMQPMSHLPAVTGGEAPKFYASVVNRVTKTDVLKDANGTIGIAIRVRNYKNKAGVPFRDANMKLYYSGGFQPDEEYIDFLIAFDIVKQKGAYFYVDGEPKSIQGRVKLQDWLNAHPDEYEAMKLKVDEMLVSENTLDVDNEAITEDTEVGGVDQINEDIDEEVISEN
jgi:RecA/RadA recombinase